MNEKNNSYRITFFMRFYNQSEDKVLECRDKILAVCPYAEFEEVARTDMSANISGKFYKKLELRLSFANQDELEKFKSDERPKRIYQEYAVSGMKAEVIDVAEDSLVFVDR